MPYARRYRRRRRNPRRPARLRRNYRRKYSKVSKISRLSTGFPTSILMKHKYVQRVSLTCTSGVVAAWYLIANSMYGPAYSGGHQPYYRDTMQTLYKNNLVYANKITIRPGSEASADFYLVCRPTLDSTLIADMDLEVERPGAICKVVSEENPSRGTLKMFRKTKQVSGYPGTLDISWHGLNGGAPSDTWYYQIAVKPVDASTTITVYLDIESIFYVRWWDRSGVSQS